MTRLSDMVQEKDAAKKRVAARKAFAEKTKRELEEKTIGFRWYVVEHTPAQSGFGYYDEGYPARNVVVSDYFETEKEAQEWFDNHEPDFGKSLHIKRDRKVREVTYRWVSY
jgi:hypothetical protein